MLFLEHRRIWKFVSWNFGEVDDSFLVSFLFLLLLLLFFFLINCGKWYCETRIRRGLLSFEERKRKGKKWKQKSKLRFESLNFLPKKYSTLLNATLKQRSSSVRLNRKRVEFWFIDDLLNIYRTIWAFRNRHNFLKLYDRLPRCRISTFP